jgi:hypothetical protein
MEAVESRGQFMFAADQRTGQYSENLGQVQSGAEDCIWDERCGPDVIFSG